MEFFSEKLSVLTGQIHIRSFTYNTPGNIGFSHSHHSFEVYFQLSGTSIFKVADERFELQENELLIISPGVSHECLFVPFEDYSNLSITFDWLFQPERDTFYAEYVKDEKRVLENMLKHEFSKVSDSCGCRMAIDILCRNLESRRMGEFIKLQNLVTDFLISAAQSFSVVLRRSDFDEITDVGISNNAVKIASYIKQHHTEDISLQSVSEALSYSPRHIQRMILEYFNVTFTDLLHEYRIGTAKKLLFESDYSIEILSQKVGYSDRRSFCKHFKNRVGFTPSEYRVSNDMI